MDRYNVITLTVGVMMSDPGKDAGGTTDEAGGWQQDEGHVCMCTLRSGLKWTECLHWQLAWPRATQRAVAVDPKPSEALSCISCIACACCMLQTCQSQPHLCRHSHHGLSSCHPISHPIHTSAQPETGPAAAELVNPLFSYTSHCRSNRIRPVPAQLAPN